MRSLLVLLTTTLLLGLLPGSARSAGEPQNATVPTLGRADRQDSLALDVGQAVLARSGSWSPDATSFDYRFLRCPTEAFGADCASATDWQTASQTNYATADAGSYAVVEVRPDGSSDESAQVFSPAKLLTIPPRIAADAYTVAGVRAGPLREGDMVDVIGTPGAVTGVPAPDVDITWVASQLFFDSDIVDLTQYRPYHGPRTLPLRFVSAEVQAVNPGGTATLDTHRVSPLFAPRFFFGGAVVRSRHGPRVGTALLPDHDYIPTSASGDPAPRVALAWLRCRPHGCRPIKAATSRTYTPRQRDRGARLILRWTATNSEGTRSVLTPLGSDALVAPTPPTGPQQLPRQLLRITVSGTTTPHLTATVDRDGKVDARCRIRSPAVSARHILIAHLPVAGLASLRGIASEWHATLRFAGTNEPDALNPTRVPRAFVGNDYLPTRATAHIAAVERWIYQRCREAPTS